MVDLFQRSVTLVAQVLGVNGCDYWQVLSDGQKLRRVASTQNILKPGYASVHETPVCIHTLDTSEPAIFFTDATCLQRDGLRQLFPDNTYGAGYILSG
ncbi:MAG: hypothetical protein AAFW95_04870, partial [Cyanobacteria bacterium J06638_6]